MHKYAVKIDVWDDEEDEAEFREKTGFSEREKCIIMGFREIKKLIKIFIDNDISGRVRWIDHKIFLVTEAGDWNEEIILVGGSLISGVFDISDTQLDVFQVEFEDVNDFGELNNEDNIEDIDLSASSLIKLFDFLYPDNKNENSYRDDVNEFLSYNKIYAELYIDTILEVLQFIKDKKLDLNLQGYPDSEFLGLWSVEHSTSEDAQMCGCLWTISSDSGEISLDAPNVYKHVFDHERFDGIFTSKFYRSYDY
jgi:hypothetical protein